MARAHDPLRLLDLRRPLTDEEDRVLADACRDILAQYRATVARAGLLDPLSARARRAFLHLGGDSARPSASLKDYDSEHWGPFLGVSTEGSAAAAIRDAALQSPKIRALPARQTPAPLVVGVAVDAERLGGVGEVAVGPDEYAHVWLACVDRVLVTTNIGTRVNVRFYRREPRVVVRGDRAGTLRRAKEELVAAFRPFVDTPDGKPRPLTVFVDIPRFVRMTVPRKRRVLTELAEFVASGGAAGRRRAPKGQRLGLAVWVGRGLAGKNATIDAIDLAASAGIGEVLVDGVVRKSADAAVSLAGLLDYFEPGIVGPLLRRAEGKKVRLRPANVPDADTIARAIWVALATARSMGANLGKYGCFPLTRAETGRVVELVQGWLQHWSAAPVFFVDQGLIREGAVDVERDLPRGIEAWLETVAKHGVRVVLIDTVDKSTGRSLLKTSAHDTRGYLSLRQIERVERRARTLGVKVLWAGGLRLSDAFALGKLRVFGIYVTTAAATTVAAVGSYANDPGLAGVKQPTLEAVLRAKILLEAGFLSASLEGDAGSNLAATAERLLTAVESGDTASINDLTTALALACRAGWPAHWRRRRKTT